MAVNIKLTDKDLLKSKYDAVVYFVNDDSDLLDYKSLKKISPNIEKLAKDKKFKGALGSVLIVPTFNDNFSYLILMGLGKTKINNEVAFENYRRAIGSLVKLLPTHNISSVGFDLPKLDATPEYIVEHTAVIAKMADYVFNVFHTDKKTILKTDINIVVSTALVKKLKSALDKGLLIAEAVNDARSWIDLPANMLTPADLAAHAESISKHEGLKCTVFTEKEIIKMGMGGLAGVSKGSELDCKLVIIEYKTKEKNAPTVAFVGKGITFDSGGLSIKPAASMETMKEDMSGAAAVIATMKVIGQLKPKINIVGIAPIAENLPSGTALKPGDIVKFYNGKTAEVKNTDAEGRLILADALSYAVKHYKPDAIIDLATLTGACAYALGPFFSGLFSQHDELTQRVLDASKVSGEAVWRLPLTDDYKVAVKADVADLCNIGRKDYMAGGTTAACFLQHFVGETPWVHLDIAGTAFNVPDVSYYRRATATGVGIRLLTELAMNWEK
ncbi:MAG: leucyl aminopeptidase [Candidatus Babeliales bacterium]|nr:leucyl aminopeptidase [Candidatus Babeliales bacterium]